MSDRILIVNSSNGHLKVDKQTGSVMQCIMDGEGIDKIKRFDLQEWKKYYPDKELPDSIDILDLGYWNKDGSYEEPVYDWRNEVKQMRNGTNCNN